MPLYPCKSYGLSPYKDTISRWCMGYRMHATTHTHTHTHTHTANNRNDKAITPRRMRNNKAITPRRMQHHNRREGLRCSGGSGVRRGFVWLHDFSSSDVRRCLVSLHRSLSRGVGVR